MMDKSAIERILKLKNSAYELLLWVNKQAEHQPEILSDRNLEKWRFGEGCESWVRDTYEMIPLSLRPTPADIPAFARLFSSFFQTSFRLVENAPTLDSNGYGSKIYVGSGNRKLVAGSPSGKKSAKGKAKVSNSARELRLIALEELALDRDLAIDRTDLAVLEQDARFQEALMLWSYFYELNRRANFASQGEAVRAMWQAMDRQERVQMSADSIIEARESLLTALKSVSARD
jgi:hypothetical protein